MQHNAKTMEDSVRSILKALETYQSNLKASSTKRGILPTGRLALRDKLSGENQRFKKQDLADELYAELTGLQNILKETPVSDAKLITALQGIDNFLLKKDINVDMLEKVFPNRTVIETTLFGANTMFGQILLETWRARNALCLALAERDNTMTAQQKKAFEETTKKYNNRLLADPLIREIRLYHPKNKHESIVDAGKRMKTLHRFFTSGLKVRDKKMIRGTLMMIRDSILVGNIEEAYARALALQNHLSSRKNEAGEPLYQIKTLDKLITHLTATYPDEIKKYQEKVTVYFTTSEGQYEELKEQNKNVLYYKVGQVPYELYYTSSDPNQTEISVRLNNEQLNQINQINAKRGNALYQLELADINIIQGITNKIEFPKTTLQALDQLPLEKRLQKFHDSFHGMFKAKIDSLHLAKGGELQLKAATGVASDIAGLADGDIFKFLFSQLTVFVSTAIAPPGASAAIKLTASGTTALMGTIINNLKGELKDSNAQDLGTQRNAITSLLDTHMSEIISAAVSAEFARSFAYQLNQAHITGYDNKYMAEMLKVGEKSLMKNLGNFKEAIGKIDWKNGEDPLGQLAKIMVKAMCSNPTDPQSKHYVYAAEGEGSQVKMEKFFSRSGRAAWVNGELTFYAPSGSKPDKYGYILVTADDIQKTSSGNPVWREVAVTPAMRDEYKTIYQKADNQLQTIIEETANKIAHRTEQNTALLRKTAQPSASDAVNSEDAIAVIAAPIQAPVPVQAPVQEMLSPFPPENNPPLAAPYTDVVQTLDDIQPAPNTQAAERPLNQMPQTNQTMTNPMASAVLMTATAASTQAALSTQSIFLTENSIERTHRNTLQTQPISEKWVSEHAKESAPIEITYKITNTPISDTVKQATLTIQEGSLEKLHSKNMKGTGRFHTHKTDQARHDRLSLAKQLVDDVITSLKKSGGVEPFTVTATLNKEYEKLGPYIKSYCIKCGYIPVIHVPEADQQKVFEKKLQKIVDDLVEKEVKTLKLT